MPKSLVFSVFFSIVFALPAAAQTVWYVDAGGTPPGQGSAADPYTSLRYAVEHPATAAGDRILVRDGVYVEDVELHEALTIESVDGPGRAMLEGRIVVHAYVSLTLRDFWVRAPSGGGGTGTGFYAHEGSFVWMERCTFSGFDVGLFVQWDFFAEHLTVSGNGTALSVDRDAWISLSNSIVWNNDQQVFCPFGYYLFFVGHSVWDDAAGCGEQQQGNLYADPLFWDPGPTCADFRVQPGSPTLPKGMGAFAFDADYDPVPAVYCTAKTNSVGCAPRIVASGRASATKSDPFVLAAEQVLPSKFGLLLYGEAPAALPFQGGTLCVAPPLSRAATQAASADGAPPCVGRYGFDFNEYVRSAADPQLVTGRDVTAQWWSRDAQDPTGFGTGLTDAVEFSIAP